MRHPALLSAVMMLLLGGCGMKGDLYEVAPPQPAGAPVTGEDAPAAESADDGRGERKTLPATPPPAQSR